MTPVTLVLANYNQAHLLRRSVEQLERALSLVNVAATFLLVDDGSTDGTWNESQALAATRPAMRLLRHEHNLGRGRSVADGLRAATTDLVATLDTDLEVAPFYLVPLLEQMSDPTVDVAVARRWYPAPLSPGRGWELGRWLAHRGYRAVVQAAFGTGVDTASGCRVFRRSSLLPVLDTVQDERWFWDTELIVRALRGGLTVREVGAYCPAKPHGRSTVALLPEISAHIRHVVRLKAALTSE